MIDASVTYFNYWQAPLLIYFGSPDPSALKFIVTLRDPADRLFSQYSMALSRDNIRGNADFEEYVTSEAKRLDACFARVLGSSRAWSHAERHFPPDPDVPALGAGPLGKPEALGRVAFLALHKAVHDCVKQNDMVALSLYDMGIRLYTTLWGQQQFVLWRSGEQGGEGGLKERLRMLAEATGLTWNEGVVREIE